MPTRDLRDGLLSSARWNDLPVEARDFYIRLLMVADDFGCFDGREGVCSSRCYPLRPMDVDSIATMLTQLHAAGLIVRYSNAGRPFIAITQWRHNLRGRRRFPAPPVNVDLDDGRPVKGMWRSGVGWANPAGYDDVSILLDLKLRPVAPQPDEWRPDSHFVRVEQDVEQDVQRDVGRDVRRTVGRDVRQETGQRQPRNPATHGKITGTPTPRVTADRMSDSASYTPSDNVSDHLRPSSFDLSPSSGDVVADVSRAVEHAVRHDVGHEPAATATTAINGIVKFENGGFVGLTEEQRLRWQEMFDAISIPDQIARAAAWLEVNHGERNAIEKQGEGFGSFIVRWLLREVRAKPE